MDKFLETYNLPKLNQEEAGSMNRPITTSDIEAVITKLRVHKSPGLEGFTEEFYKIFKKELTSVLQGYWPIIFFLCSLYLVLELG